MHGRKMVWGYFAPEYVYQVSELYDKSFEKKRGVGEKKLTPPILESLRFLRSLKKLPKQLEIWHKVLTQ